MAPSAAVAGIGVPTVTALDSAETFRPASIISADAPTDLGGMAYDIAAAQLSGQQQQQPAEVSPELRQAGVDGGSLDGSRVGGNSLPDMIEPMRDVRGAEIERANQLAVELAEAEGDATVENDADPFMPPSDFQMFAFASLPGSGSSFEPGLAASDPPLPGDAAVDLVAATGPTSDPFTGLEPEPAADTAPPAASSAASDSHNAGDSGEAPGRESPTATPPQDEGTPGPAGGSAPSGFAPEDGGDRETPAGDDDRGPAPTEVPEPAALGLFALGSLAIGMRRRIRRR